MAEEKNNQKWIFIDPEKVKENRRDHIIGLVMIIGFILIGLWSWVGLIFGW